MATVLDGYIVAPDVFDVAEVQTLQAGVENAVARAVAVAEAVGPEKITVDGPGHRFPGHRLQTIPGNPDTSIHWESLRSRPTVRNLRPVTHLDPRLHARWADPRLTGPAAQLLGVPEVGPLTSKISLKRARVRSEFIWHQDYTFLHRFLGPTAEEAVAAMVLLDDDQIITPTSEHAMAQRAHSTVTEFNGGSHLTLISHPDAVTAVIQSAINSVH